MYGSSNSGVYGHGGGDKNSNNNNSNNSLLYSNYQQDHLIDGNSIRGIGSGTSSPLSAQSLAFGIGLSSTSPTPIINNSNSNSNNNNNVSQTSSSSSPSPHSTPFYPQQQQPMYNPTNGLYGYPSHTAYDPTMMGVDQQDDYYDGSWFEMRVVPEYPSSNVSNPITCLKFDQWEELLWIGYQNGKISSLINPTLDRFSSFFVDKTEIKDLLVDSEGILSLSKTALSYHSRGGAPVYQLRSEKMKDLNAVSFSNFNNTELVIGSDQNILYVVDFYTGKVVKEVNMPSGVKTINRGRSIWCGQTNGEISMVDPRTWRIESSLPAHKGDIKSVDIKGDLLVSCGCSPRLGQLYVDPIVRVYDVKTLRSLPPIQYKRPSIVKFHPIFYSTLVVVSESSNQIYLCDVQGDQSSNQFYQIDSLFGYLSSFDISPTGDCMAFGDSGGTVHQWAEKDDIHVNINPYPTECVPFTQLSRPAKMDEYSPLSQVGNFEQPIPLYEQYLLSHWKPNLSYPVGLPTRPINSSLLVHLKQHDFVGYISNTGISRKQIRGKAYEDGSKKTLSNLTLSSMSHIRPPKSYRWGEMKFKKFGVEDFNMVEYNKTKFAGLENILPNSYSNSCIQNLYFIPQIKETMLNHLCTKHYCCSCELGFVFQMMDKCQGNIVDTSNFIRVLKQIPQTSALGIFLSSEQPDPQIQLTQLIANFNRFILEQIQKEMTPPILTYNNNSSNNTSTNSSTSISTTNTTNNNHDTIIDKLFGSTSISNNKCINCGHQYEKQSKQFQYDMVYPNSLSELGSDGGATFSNLLKLSLCKQIKSPAWCEKCSTFSSTFQKKQLKSLPNILCINANCLKKENEDYWKYEITNIIPGTKTFIATTTATTVNNTATTTNVPLQQPTTNNNNTTASTTSSTASTTTPSEEITWLPLKIRIKINSEDGQLSIIEYPNNLEKSKLTIDPKELVDEITDDGQLYELTSCISHIKDQIKRIPKQGHLVTQIKVSDFYNKEFKDETFELFGYDPNHNPFSHRPRNYIDSNWFNINDFKINECTSTDVTHFDSNWKTPATLYYTKVVSNSSAVSTNNNNVNNNNNNNKNLINSAIPVPTHIPTITKEVYLQNNIVSCKSPINFKPATSTTIPSNGELVAIDTEFVSIGPEETQVSSDGKRVIIQPGNFSLARVSIIREDGEAFFDDYIQSIEPVTDYLTRFSGINPGDLDPSVSSKNVITLKNCYLKLRYLVDQGVKFIGHGLKKDFRIINIYVPPAQIIDTVELFQLRNQRKLSLRFLAYILLKIDIQSETHCSVEDAKTAMDLYKAYLILVKNKEFDETLNKIYQIGRSLAFKVPEPNSTDQQLPPPTVMDSVNFNFDLSISFNQLFEEIDQQLIKDQQEESTLTTASSSSSPITTATTSTTALSSSPSKNITTTTTASPSTPTKSSPTNEKNHKNTNNKKN